MRSFRFRVAGALGLTFLPVSWDFIPAILPALRAEAPATSPPRTYWRSSFIRLPIQMEPRTRAGLSELKLFVKKPGGDWSLAQSGPATVSGFDYRADKDGEYAFIFVAVDKSGRSNPTTPDSRPPHQVIVVDTAPPELAVQPLPVANRDIFLQCQVRDANPDWSSVKLEYLAGDGDWRAMERANPDAPGAFRIPHASVLESKVRATAKDKAGNVAQRIIDLGDPTQSFSTASRPAPVRPSAPTVPDDPSLILPPETPDHGPAQVAHKNPPRSGAPEIKVFDTSPKQPPTSAYNPNKPVVAEKSDPVAVPVPDVLPPALDPQNPADIKVAPPPDANPTVTPKVDPYFPDLAAKPLPAKADGPKPDAPRIEIPPTADAKPATAPQGGHAIINTTRCTLDYAVENVIVGGQAKMEFWATRDSGKSWSRVQDESGGTSPARLLLPGDGYYGIRVKANGTGTPPQAGEAPDAWVEVDTVVPTVRLLPPTLGTGQDAGTLTISWMVHDRNLANDSLNLYHATRRDGPWLPIATGLRNDGTYRWLIPAGVGAEVYIKLEASDRAGNVGKAELQDPVAMPQPKVKVLGIGPAR